MIRWDEDCLRPGDRSTTREKLLQTKWNPAPSQGRSLEGILNKVEHVYTMKHISYTMK
jgi:hypothetical protein